MGDPRIQGLVVADLVRELKAIGEDGFRLRYGHPFLVLVFSPPRQDFDEDESTVQTELASLVEVDTGDAGGLNKLVIPLSPTGRGRTRQKLVAGRLASCDIIIRESKVSREHAAFFERGGKWFVEDLRSSNGTRVNGKRLASGKPVRLKSGDMVAIWRFMFQFVEFEPFCALLRMKM
ncbi:MAG: FHA domain-containing protein [Deltaproteobacteria bacterium]|nr:MAG: FHA domain-containing protein [Deltaproteobacteria bacterium]